MAWSADNDSVLYATGKTLTIKPLSVNAKANSVSFFQLLNPQSCLHSKIFVDDKL